MWRLFFILWFTLLAMDSSVAQQPFFKNYQIKDGLLSNYIYTVFQDSQGYIWLSSDVGVSRFDGQQFTNYNTAHQLPDNEVFSMFEASDGKLWFATLTGKPCFFYRDRIYSEHNLPFLKSCDAKGMIIGIYEMKDGRIAYCSTHKVILIDLKHQRKEERSCGEGILATWQLANGHLGGIGRSLLHLNKTAVQPIMPSPSNLQPMRTLTIQDTLLLSSSRQLFVCLPDQRQTIALQSPLATYNEFIFLRKTGNTLWAGTRDGVYALAYPSLRVEHYFLSGRSVSSVLEDREGGLWFSTFEEGVFYVPAPNVQHFTTKDGLLFNRVTCLSRDAEQRLWIGSESSAFSIYDGKKITSRQIFPENVKNKNIRRIRHFADGTTLVIGKAATLYLKDGAEKYLCHRSADVNIAKDGSYWVGLTGLYHLKPKVLPQVLVHSETLEKYGLENLYSQVRQDRLAGVRIERIVFDETERKWLATPNGLYSFKIQEPEQLILPYGTKDLDFDPKTQVLWVLTESHGLYAIRKGRIIDSLSIANKRGNVICWDMCQDERGDLWIGTAGGLFRVTGKPGALKLIDYWGMLGLGFEKINAVEAIGNHLYIGKDDGLLRVPRSALSRPSPLPKVIIKGIRADSSGYLQAANQVLHIPYQRRNLTIEYEGLSYREAQNIRYRYRLNGSSLSWTETTSELLPLVNIPPGRYTFEVMALNGAGAMSPEVSTLRFWIKSPFWQQYWFYALLAVGVIGTMLWWIRAREQKLRRKFELENLLNKSSKENSELQKRISDLQLLSLRLQMNPHFIFNALNTIKGYYGQERVVEANAFIGKFARLLRLNLDYSDTLIPLDQEIELLKIYVQLSQIRFPGKIHLDLSCAADIHPTEMLIPSMLIQPFVENAVIHGVVPKKELGTIFIHFAKVGSHLLVTVKDNGVGRKSSNRLKLHTLHKPLATQITRDRLQLMGSKPINPLVIHDLIDDSGQPMGTEVQLSIPFQYKQPT